jgi:hypothetical protein
VERRPQPFVWTKTADQIPTPSPPTAAELTPHDTSHQSLAVADAPPAGWGAEPASGVVSKYLTS